MTSQPTTAPVDLRIVDEHRHLVPHWPDKLESPAMADLLYHLTDPDTQIAALAAAGMGTDLDPDPCPQFDSDTDWQVINAAAADWEKDTFGATGIALHKLRGGIPIWWVTRQECRDALTAHASAGTTTVDEQLVDFLRRAAAHHGFIAETSL